VSASFAEINGHRLRYRVQGEGPLAVFGHGLLGSIEQLSEYQPGFEAICERVRLLTYDARGHGESSGPEACEGYTWETLGRDMAALVAHAGEESAILGGGSMGAATALWVALERPEVVRGLVLVMPPPLGPPPARGPREQQAIMMLDMLSAAVGAYGLEKTVELAKAIPGFAATPEEADAKARWMLRQNPLALAYAVRGLIAAPGHDPECYRSIRVPTLVLAHEGDGLHPARSAQLLADTIPGARVRIADHADYWHDHHDEFLAELHAFLDGLA
jgi:pimeloyl-ACP methyl ester carboxylesterase